MGGRRYWGSVRSLIKILGEIFFTLNPLSLLALEMAICSTLQIEQLSVFFGTEQLILNSIFHLISENSLLFDMLNLARAVVSNFLRMLITVLLLLPPWFKEVSVEPMSTLPQTFALHLLFKWNLLLNSSSCFSFSVARSIRFVFSL